MENPAPEKPAVKYTKLLWACALAGGLLPGAAVLSLMALTDVHKGSIQMLALTAAVLLTASALYGLLPALLTGLAVKVLKLKRNFGGIVSMTVIGGLVSAGYAALTSGFREMLFDSTDPFSFAFFGIFSAFMLSVFLPDGRAVSARR